MVGHLSLAMLTGISRFAGPRDRFGVPARSLGRVVFEPIVEMGRAKTRIITGETVRSFGAIP